MTSLVTSKFKNYIIDQLGESLVEPANTIFYVMACKHTPFENGDDEIPSVTQSVSEIFIDPYQTGVFGKKLTNTNVTSMTKRYEWTANTIYDMYDDQDTDLINKTYFVVTFDENNSYVYKVLDNNNGSESTEKPVDMLESACNFITTSDGYKWKYMYSLPLTTFNKFATDGFIPVTTNASVAGNSVPGAIDVIKVVNAGSDYVSTFVGQLNSDDLRSSIPGFSGDSTNYRLANNASANNGFYVGSAMYISNGAGYGQLKKITSYLGGSTKVISLESEFTTPPDATSSYVIAPFVIVAGDGSNAIGYAVVNSSVTVNNYIQRVEIINRGNGYTYGEVQITGNTGGGSNTAALRAIIPPKGGHGSNCQVELFSTNFGISIDFSNNESGFISTENDYRSIVILRDPLFNGVTLTLANTYGTFTDNERIYQCDIKLLAGNVSISSSNTTILGTSTDFYNSLKTSDVVMLVDPVNNIRCIRSVTSVNTSVQQITVNSLPTFTATSGRIYHTSLNCSGLRSGNSLPYIELSNAEAKFVTGKLVIGESSGAFGNVTAIELNEKPINNWTTFDNRYRFQYTSIEGSIDEDSLLYQGDVSLANCEYHSSNDTFVFVTSVKGNINADPIEPLLDQGSNSSFTLGSNKYNSDLVKGSGEIVYKENFFPISRNANQSETIKIVLSF